MFMTWCDQRLDRTVENRCLTIAHIFNSFLDVLGKDYKLNEANAYLGKHTHWQQQQHQHKQSNLSYTIAWPPPYMQVFNHQHLQLQSIKLLPTPGPHFYLATLKDMCLIFLILHPCFQTFQKSSFQIILTFLLFYSSLAIFRSLKPNFKKAFCCHFPPNMHFFLFFLILNHFQILKNLLPFFLFSNHLLQISLIFNNFLIFTFLIIMNSIL